MNTPNAAIILCAGKGSRMNDNSTNKVCFDCAGIPVIKRIITEMRQGGIGLFVIVVGCQAEAVMGCLDGEDGIIYAFQKEQKGTGHAVRCGLKALQAIGYKGNAVISMGDKIIAANVIKDLVGMSRKSPVIWCVQPVADNYPGGRVVVKDGMPYGVVEFPDAAMMSLAGLPKGCWADALKRLRLNSRKAEKVLKTAEAKPPQATRTLGGVLFTAEEILNTPYANAGLYCLNCDIAISAIDQCNADNAQGEIYMTDALEVFARNKQAALYEITTPDAMLTYSTKPELLALSLRFMRTASEFLQAIDNGEFQDMFSRIYDQQHADEQKQRYSNVLRQFIHKYGDRKVIITRAPGRINLMGRHIDHRGGGINAMALNRDIIFVSSPRSDDLVNITNTDATYPDASFSISETLALGSNTSWLDYLNSHAVRQQLEATKGQWVNYVKSAVLRLQLTNDNPLCGMDILANGFLPAAAGLSSSSAIVVAVAEAVVAFNSLHLTQRDFVTLCGEGEWFVGSRGGAGDHATMKCCKDGQLIHLSFKPFDIGTSAAFSSDYALIVADSMIKSKKSEGSKDTFNAKVASYDLALLCLQKAFPQQKITCFKDLTTIRPYATLYRMLMALPLNATRQLLMETLPDDLHKLTAIFATHADPGVYNLRGVMLYGLSEFERSDRFMSVLKAGDYKALGDMMKTSHNGDRISQLNLTDELLTQLAECDADIALQTGAYGCSTPQIDAFCDILNATPGVLGSELVGAGLGGCVIALVEAKHADDILQVIHTKYYEAYGYQQGLASVYTPSCGSSVIF